MKISRLNIAVLIQTAGLLMFLLTWNLVIRIAGILAIIVGAVLYRRERKRLKTAVTTELNSSG